MKKTLFIMAVLLFSASLSYAATEPKWSGSGGWSGDSRFNRMYDQGSVEAVKGEVVSIDRVSPARGMSPGIHISLKTSSGVLPVHLGPAWYLENQDIKISAGDRIEVVGSRVDIDGNPSIIAASVIKGDQKLTLRDEKGFPAWAGWRRR